MRLHKPSGVLGRVLSRVLQRIDYATLIEGCVLMLLGLFHHRLGKVTVDIVIEILVLYHSLGTDWFSMSMEIDWLTFHHLSNKTIFFLEHIVTNVDFTGNQILSLYGRIVSWFSKMHRYKLIH